MTPFVKGLTQDIRFALRGFRAHPIVTVLGAVSLALAIGGNATAFSLVSAILLRPLPYPEPDRLVTLWQTDEENQSFDLLPVSPANFVDWTERSRSFEQMAALEEMSFSLTGDARREPVLGVAVTTNLFDLVGAEATLGRTFVEEDGLAGRDRVVVLGHTLWKNRFGSDAGVVGQTVKLRGEPYRVIGVLDETFELLDPRYELWVPLTFPQGKLARDVHTLGVFARLKPAVSLDEAREEMKVIAATLQSEYPDDNDGTSATVLTLQEQMAYGGGQQILALLQGALFFVLAIAAANLANLLLARGQNRQREVALRAALGATRGRLVRQFLVESLLLTLGGGLLGLLLGAWGIDFMAATFATELPRNFLPQMDANVVGFTFLASLAAGVAFGLAPAFHGSRPSLSGTLQEGGRGSASDDTRPRRRLLAKTLVVVEVAIALVLLSGVGIFVRSVRHWRGLDSGVHIENLLTFDLTLPNAGYTETREVSELYRTLLDILEALPGVTEAALANHLPRSPFPPRERYTVDGKNLSETDKRATTLVVSTGYFRAMAIPLARGRAFTLADREDGPPVLIINESMERTLFPERDALSNRISVGGTSREIVGIARNVREDLFRDVRVAAEPIIYLPVAQNPLRQTAVVLQTAREPSGVSGSVLSAVADIDPNLTVSAVLTMKEYVAQFFVGVGAVNALLSVFGGLAVLLAAVGIYGVIAFSVARRTHEVGVRMALGARSRDVVDLVIREGLVLAAIGFAIGLPGAFLIGRAVSNVLAGLVQVAFGATLAVSFVLFLVALAASYVPARRAARLNPVAALRHE